MKSTERAKKILATFTGSLTDRPAADFLLQLFIRECELDREAVFMVIDEYHVIKNEVIHEVLQQLIFYLPENLCIVLISREDLPFRTSRLRLQGRMTEIRMNELAWSTDDIRNYILQSTGTSIPEKYVDVLAEKTEGWPAALALFTATLAGKSIEQIIESIRFFSAANQYVIDYFLEEILSSLDESVVAFLSRTAYLEHLFPDLCSHVTGLSNSNEMLRRLRQMNLPIIPITGTETAYRYHHLFADYLRSQYGHTVQKEVLYSQAANWCQEHNYINEALHYILLSGNKRLVDTFVERCVKPAFFDGHFLLVSNWVDKIPEATSMYKGWILLSRGLTDEVENIIGKPQVETDAIRCLTL